METNNGDDYEDEAPNKTFDWSYDYLQELDTSQYPFPNELWHLKSIQEITIKATLMTIIGVVGLTLNLIIMIIILRNKWLWTASNILIANLALVDFLTLLFCPWFMLVRDFYQNFVLGNFGCRFEGFLQGYRQSILHTANPELATVVKYGLTPSFIRRRPILCSGLPRVVTVTVILTIATLLLSSVGAVMLVSYDRMAAAALTPDARITKKGAPKLILASWIMALIFSLPWILKRVLLVRPWLDYIEIFCLEDVTFLTIYWHIKLIVLVWTPLGLTAFAYGSILWRIERSIKRLRANGTVPSIGRARGKAMRITAGVLAAAVICRLPYSILIYWRNNLNNEINAVDGAFSVMWFAANYLMYVNSALNPLIYGFTNERFLRAMDSTPGIACFRFGSWCCCQTNVTKRKTIRTDDKHTEKIFVIENSPKYEKKFGYCMKNMLHIHKDSHNFSIPAFPKVDEITNKPTRITPLTPV